MQKKKVQNDVGRNWTFVIYPDSCVANYREILDNLHCAWCESPVHDKDYDEGKLKKPHIHILLTFEGNKTYNQIMDIAKSVNGVIAPLKGKNGESCKVSSIRGMTRYFVHVDNPEKAQYEKSGIVCHGGFDKEQYFAYAAEQTKLLLAEMMDWCDEFSIFEYSDLLTFARKEKYDTWFDLLTIGRQSFVMIKYIDSKRHSNKEILYAQN